MSTIGEYLKNLRGGISIRAVADATGISNAYLSQLEGGKRENPHPEILKKLAKFYSIPMIEMLKQAGYLEEDEEPKETYLEKIERLYKYVTNGEGYIEIARQGMTIRQEFVKAAMQGLLAHGFASAIGNTSEELATLSCEMADACLKKELETRERDEQNKNSLG